MTFYCAWREPETIKNIEDAILLLCIIASILPEKRDDIDIYMLDYDVLRYKSISATCSIAYLDMDGN